MRTGTGSPPPANTRAGRPAAAELVRYASFVALAVGALIRILDYVGNRSLSFDESLLALNLLEKSTAELIDRLDFRQAAPIGFLEVEKLASSLLGESEYALRLVPLLASLAALPLFYHAARRLLPAVAVPFSCAAFALFDPLVYYGTAVKPYALDVVAAVLLYVFATSALADAAGRNTVILTVAGVVTVWFSFAAVFVLAAVIAVVVLRAIRARHVDEARRVGLIVGVWVISFGIHWYLARPNIERIRGSFEPGRLLLRPEDEPGENWFEAATRSLRYLVGLEDTATGSPVLGALPAGVRQGAVVLLVVMVLLGFLALARRRPWSAMLVGLPALLVLVASAAHEYPLLGRTLLFLLPSVALCLGEALRLLVLTGHRAARCVGAATALAALAAIALLPAIHVVESRAGEGIRSALNDLRTGHRRGDVLYLGHFAQYGFVYYSLCGCAAFDPRAAWPFATTSGPAATAPALIPRSQDLVLGSVTPSDEIPVRDGRLLRGRGRAWVLISQTSPDESRRFLAALDRFGRRVRDFSDYGAEGVGASLFLYDMSRSAPRS